MLTFTLKEQDVVHIDRLWVTGQDVVLSMGKTEFSLDMGLSKSTSTLKLGKLLGTPGVP